MNTKHPDTVDGEGACILSPASGRCCGRKNRPNLAVRDPVVGELPDCVAEDKTTESSDYFPTDGSMTSGGEFTEFEN